VGGRRGAPRDGRARLRRGGRRAVGAVHLGVELGEARAVGAAPERVVAGLNFAPLEAAQALERVLRPADGLAELAVARQVDADVGLLLHDFLHRAREAFVVRLLVVRQAALLRRDELEQLRRPDQAAAAR